MLYLESGATPIRYVVSSRRINYFHTIMKREDEELTKRILKAQIHHPSPGDFIRLVEDDFLKIGVQMDLCFVPNPSNDVFNVQKLCEKQNQNSSPEIPTKSATNTH